MEWTPFYLVLLTGLTGYYFPGYPDDSLEPQFASGEVNFIAKINVPCLKTILDLWYRKDVENIIPALAGLCFITYFWDVMKRKKRILKIL